ncbi:MAG TPA: ABC transporter substrate-binding protein [Stellaceae bacterium]|nr:ABC transporter substrate-binding protein [Stellaceae bacterium]
MDSLTRRSVLGASLGIAAAGAFARPYIASAAAKTMSLWWTQGFVPDEDAAIKKAVADYEKQSGNKIDLSIVPFAPLREKIVSAITSGVVPDAISATPPEITPEQAWLDKLVDVSDVVDTQSKRFMPIALDSSRCYNNVKKEYAYYGVPFDGSVVPFHIWSSLVEKAGYKMSELPNKWDAFIDFFHPVQKKLRAMGMRHTYASAFVVSTTGNDPLNTFNAWLIAYGGGDVVTKQGKLNSSKPIKDAYARAVGTFAQLFKDGYIPHSSVNWNDADDNNAFHSQLAVMDFDGTLSTEMAMKKPNPQAYWHEVVTMGLPLSNEGQPVASQFGVNTIIIPKGAKNVEVAKDFSKFFIQPEVVGAFTKGGLGRWLPVMPELVKNDPWWTDPKIDPHRPPYVKQGFDGPLLPLYYVYNPAWAQVRTEHLSGIAFHEAVTGMSPTAATEKAFKRMEEIFSKYEIKQA